MELTALDKLVAGACLWAGILLTLSTIFEPTPENLTLAGSITLSGAYTWLLYLTRSRWMGLFISNPQRGAFLVGSLNAAVIETLFLVVEKTFGAVGVAAHPNLLIDLLITMPWYLGMIWIFVRVQKEERFPPGAVLLLGAVYELGADGIIGGLIFPTITGSPPDLLGYGAFMVLAVFWQFIPVYSSMVLPPAWILASQKEPSPPSRPRWLRGFLPLLWMIPYLLYAMLLFFLISALGI
jgi:hypothetical protein